MTSHEIEPSGPGRILPYVDEDSMSKAKLIFYTVQDKNYRSEIVGALHREPDLDKSVKYASKLLNNGGSDFYAGASRAIAILFILEKEGYATFPKVWGAVSVGTLKELREFDKNFRGLVSSGDREGALGLIGDSLLSPHPEKYQAENPHLVEYFLEPKIPAVRAGEFFVYELKRRQVTQHQLKNH